MKSISEIGDTSTCKPENVIKGDKYRITVLTEHLLRLEYSEDGEFIDAASQTVVNRDFPAVEFSVKDTGDELELRTKYLQLNYNKKGILCKRTFLQNNGSRHQFCTGMALRRSDTGSWRNGPYA